MEKVEVVKTESGKFLTHDDDGFVVYGSITKPHGGGLFGGNVAMKAFEESGIPATAYTVEEFLDGLYISTQVLQDYLDKRIFQKKW